MSKKKKQISSIKFSFSVLSITIYLIISSILIFCTFYFKQEIEGFLNYNSITTTLDNDGLVMHTIEVGQAEAIIIKLPDNKNLMIDSGDDNNTSRQKVLSYLENNYFPLTDNKIIDYFILTHSDADHCGGVKEIFDEYEVKKVFRPKIYSSKYPYDYNLQTDHTKRMVNTNIYFNAITSIYNENCEISFSEAGIQIIESSYSITFYGPLQDYYDDVNEFSPIIVIEYNSKTIMLTGDATKNNEAEILDAYTLPEVDIYNAGHHGSKDSNSMNFLTEISPRYVVISCGLDNSYKHPHTETLNRLKEFTNDNFIFRTDKNGNIIVNIQSSGEIGVIVDVTTLNAYIKAEMMLAVVLIVLFSLFFARKTKNTKKTS